MGFPAFSPLFLCLRYAKSYITLAVNNESPWNYLRGLAMKPEATAAQLADISAYCKSVLELDDTCVHARSLLVYLLAQGSAEQKREAIEASFPVAVSCCVVCVLSSASLSCVCGVVCVSGASQHCDQLGKIDATRQSYWAYQKQLIK